MVFSLSNGEHNGRWRDVRGFVCENGLVLVAVAHNVIQMAPAALYGAGAGVLIVGLLIGVLINRQRGHRAIAQRLMALASRLGVEPTTTTARLKRRSVSLKRPPGRQHGGLGVQR